VTQVRRRVLNDRYEIEGVLGQGGMAKVFRGTDRVLGRTVAVKVLSPQFADDQQFVTRFRREAQSAAALNHPNIVSVFDTGDQGDVHFIVMEYVEGRTLRDAIRAEGPLHPERAVEITEAVARGLSTAHGAGMVHRDIKPGNIMLTGDGEVKVMDFGIARTSTGDTLTQTAAVLGTASYLSPEQAQGESVDARSDIYSLGCVMYEMLTGRAPFTGDSPVAIAYKHVRDDPVPPSRVNPDIPADVEAIVLKAMAKNPANRYQSAEEMRQDLQRAAQGLPTLATPVLAGDATQVLGGDDGTAVMEEAPPEEEERRKRRWVPILVALLILALLGVAAFFLVRALTGPPEVPSVEVPQVVGLQEEEATARLEREGFQVRVETRFSDRRQGRVLEQDPAGGEPADQGSTVTITVSRGPQQVEVPGVVGQSLESAQATLEDAGLVGEVVSEEPSDDFPEPGTVIGQDPGEGDQIEEGGSVALTVSSGPATTTVPNLICNTPEEAQGQLEEAGLEYSEGGSRPSTECGGEEGVVIEQRPDDGETVEIGSTVTVALSEGPAPPTGPTAPTGPTGLTGPTGND
jgi:eukaryotic-like serine/threonine-protein kinase